MTSRTPPLSAAYAAVVAWRRQWYASRPDARRRLASAVISVGNLRVGGRGKTPTVMWLARTLAAAGERPAVLSRGYGRSHAADGVTVVSDGERVLAGLAESGDEALMMARRLTGVPVLVSADRYLAGVMAERTFGCTVHLLDDGFQHVTLERDVNLLLAAEEDLEDVPLPAGRLREALAAARAADALIDVSADPSGAGELARTLGIARAFRLARRLERAQSIEEPGLTLGPGEALRVYAVAGIAEPERFFAELTRAGWVVTGARAYRDHRRYTRKDVEEIGRAARLAGAEVLVTTEKDAVRLEPHAPLPLRAAWVPLDVHVEPTGEFHAWLAERLRAAREPRAARA